MRAQLTSSLLLLFCSNALQSAEPTGGVKLDSYMGQFAKPSRENPAPKLKIASIV
jgi:hypothetical protein